MIEALRVRHEQEPNRVFCTFADETVTYEDLFQRVRRCAAGLRHIGIAADDRVALMLRNHVDHIVLVWALAWVGAVHVPVSVHLKESGLKLQLTDVDPQLVVVEDEFVADVARATSDAPRRLIVRTQLELGDSNQASTWQDLMNLRKEDVPLPPANPGRAVMISYTSGTTGAPKGVILNERYLELGTRSAARLSGTTASDVIFLWEPFYHIAGWISVHMAMHTGARLAMVERFSASKCWDQIRETGSTKLHYLGGVLNILLAQPEQPDDADNPVTVVWGAAAPKDTWELFERRFGVTLKEGYGISEAANFALLNLNGPNGSIGKPIDEFEAWIAGDSTHQPAPPGRTGEIILKPKVPGIIMGGYYNNPSKTAETLNDGVVRTGDLGYQDEEGNFYFAGRVKDSIRRRGENVSAWEVERVINEHPGVTDSAMVPVPSPLGEDDIKVYLLVEPGSNLTPAEVYEWCKPRLAYYQVPRFLELVNELPYGPTQRVQKQKLSREAGEAFDAESLKVR